MSLKYFLVGAAIAAALGFHVFANPVIAAKSLKEAIEQGDEDAVVAMIDFPALRVDLKADLSASMAGENPMARAFGGAVVAGMVDGLTQPDAVASLMAKRATATAGGAVGQGSVDDYSLGFGLTKFTVTVQTETGPASIVFAPRGLTWKVVGADVDLSRFTSRGF